MSEDPEKHDSSEPAEEAANSGTPSNEPASAAPPPAPDNEPVAAEQLQSLRKSADEPISGEELRSLSEGRVDYDEALGEPSEPEPEPEPNPENE